MIRLLVVYAVVAIGLAEPDAAPDPATIHHEEHDHGVRFYRGEEHHHGHNPHARGSDKRSRIVDFALGPIFYEPTWVLDYRFLKTDGRDYTYSDAGGIIILPKGIRSKEHNEYRDYDSLVEHLRLKLMAQEEADRRHYHKHDHEWIDQDPVKDHGARHVYSKKHKTDTWWHDNTQEGSQ